MLRTTLLIALVVGSALPGQARVLMTTKKALELAFPGCKVERGSKTLSKEQRQKISKLSGQPFKKSMVFPYVARRGKSIVGTAWFDVHRVRAKKQLLMVVVDPNQKVRRVEILAFAEPRKYMPPKRWLGRLSGKQLGKVRPGRDVPRITGATLTVRATTQCVQRILATHRIVFGQAKVTSSRASSRPVTSKPAKR